MSTWVGVNAGLIVLLYDVQACLKGQQLQQVCSTLQTLCAAEINSSKPWGTRERLHCVQSFVKAMQLLAKLLSARKRARDWKQQENSSRVSTVLAAATAVLHPSLYANTSAGGKMCKRMLGDTDLMPLVAAAQQEVAQLVLAHAQQQQHQHQHPGNQQQHQQQSLVLLLSLAQQLLLWWCEASTLWLLHPDRSKHAEATTAAAAEGY